MLLQSATVLTNHEFGKQRLKSSIKTKKPKVLMSVVNLFCICNKAFCHRFIVFVLLKVHPVSVYTYRWPEVSGEIFVEILHIVMIELLS